MGLFRRVRRCAHLGCPMILRRGSKSPWCVSHRYCVVCESPARSQGKVSPEGKPLCDDPLICLDRWYAQHRSKSHG